MTAWSPHTAFWAMEKTSSFCNTASWAAVSPPPSKIKPASSLTALPLPNKPKVKQPACGLRGKGLYSPGAPARQCIKSPALPVYGGQPPFRKGRAFLQCAAMFSTSAGKSVENRRRRRFSRPRGRAQDPERYGKLYTSTCCRRSRARLMCLLTVAAVTPSLRPVSSCVRP